MNYNLRCYRCGTYDSLEIIRFTVKMVRPVDLEPRPLLNLPSYRYDIEDLECRCLACDRVVKPGFGTYEVRANVGVLMYTVEIVDLGQEVVHTDEVFFNPGEEHLVYDAAKDHVIRVAEMVGAWCGVVVVKDRREFVYEH